MTLFHTTNHRELHALRYRRCSGLVSPSFCSVTVPRLDGTAGHGATIGELTSWESEGGAGNLLGVSPDVDNTTRNNPRCDASSSVRR
jgi:hypothetical protein